MSQNSGSTSAPKAPKYVLKVDELTFADIRFFSAMNQGQLTDVEVIDWMDKHIEGGVMHLKRSEFNDLYEEIWRQYYGVENPTDKEGKA
jgi:hypothetical protein